MAFETLLTTNQDGIYTISLNRPEKRNAINYQMIADLKAALDEAEQSATRVLMLTGEGKAFCSGMDLEALKEMIGRPREQSVKDSETMAQLFRTIYEFPKPTIAAVKGAAMAGGTGIATMCDFTLAAPETKFGYTEVRIGFIPAIVSAFLIAQIGDKRARDLLLTGRVFEAEEAHRIGLVNEVVPDEFLLIRAQKLANILMENSPASLRATKKLLNSYSKERLDAQIAEAIRDNAAIRETPDFKEGISAFLEKRKPKWHS